MHIHAKYKIEARSKADETFSSSTRIAREAEMPEGRVTSRPRTPNDRFVTMARTLPALLLCVLAALVRVASAEVYFEERFDAAWADRWLKSDWHVSDGTAGDFTRTAGKWYGDAEADAGVHTGPDARFYAMSADMGKTFTNENKPLVLQVRVPIRT